MDDAASLRERVHGVTAAAPKTWDESESKGYDPDYKFDESKVKRDTDPGEEGRFDKKTGGRSAKLSEAEKKKRSFARWYARQPKSVRDFLAWLHKQPQDVKDWFNKLAKLSPKERRALLGLDDLPDVKEMRNGAINLRQRLKSPTDAPSSGRKLQEDEVPLKSPSGAKLVDFSGGVGHYSDGSTYDHEGWHKPASSGGSGDRQLQEDEVPTVSPSGAKLVDFSGGVGHYSDGSTFDKDGWHNTMKASITATATSAWKPDARKEAAVKGQALPDGSYPIKDKADWYKARQAIGRGGPQKRAAIIAHLKKRAKALGIPESELEGLTASVNGLTAAMPNGLGRWDPDLHPRGRDGKFIESLGFVSGLFKWERKAPSENTRAKVLGFAENKADPDDPFVVVQGKGKERGYAKASEVAQVAGPKGYINAYGQLLPTDEEMDAQIDAEMAVDLAADERDYNDRNEGTAGFERSRDFTQDDEYEQSKEVKPKQLTLSDAPPQGPPGTRPDLGTPGMNIRQNVARDEGEDERFANSPDEMYANLYDQPDDLEQFPEAAETPRLDADVAPAQPPTATRGEFTYSFDEGNWANAEVWRWNSETGEGEMIGRAHIVGDDKAQFVRNGESKPFPRTFANAQELIEVAAETDFVKRAPDLPGAAPGSLADTLNKERLGAEPDLMHLDEGRFDAQQERGKNLEPFESEEEREQKRAELRERVKHMSAKSPVDELAEMREKLRKRVHDKAS